MEDNQMCNTFMKNVNFIPHQGDANQSYNEVSSHPLEWQPSKTKT
jgi:hypothetical protein